MCKVLSSPILRINAFGFFSNLARFVVILGGVFFTFSTTMPIWSSVISGCCFDGRIAVSLSMSIWLLFFFLITFLVIGGHLFRFKVRYYALRMGITHKLVSLFIHEFMQNPF